MNSIQQYISGRCSGFLSTKLLNPLLICFFTIHLSGTEAPRVNVPAGSTGEMIQAALDRLPEGGEVVLAPGTYEIHQPIILQHDNITLRGSGLTTVLHLARNANCPVIILGAPLASSQRTTSRLRVADLQIDGNRLNQGAEFWRAAIDGSQLNNNGIDVWNVNDSTVEGVVCRSCRSGGLVTATTRRLEVRDFTAYDNQFDGLACYLTEDSRFTRLHLHDNLAAGISLDLAFIHNTITDSELTGNDLGIFMRDSRNNIFEGLTISRSKKYGVFMAQTGTSPDGVWQLCPGTECTGNNFKGLVITDCGQKPFLINNASCKDNVIQNVALSADYLGDVLRPVEKAAGIETVSASK